MLIDWGRCHELLDLLGIPDGETLFGRLRKMLSRYGFEPPPEKPKPDEPSKD